MFNILYCYLDILTNSDKNKETNVLLNYKNKTQN